MGHDKIIKFMVNWDVRRGIGKERKKYLKVYWSGIFNNNKLYQKNTKTSSSISRIPQIDKSKEKQTLEHHSKTARQSKI